MGSSDDQKGGLKTLPFIMANETFEKVASTGLMVNMIIYLTKEYHMQPATGASILFIWAAVSNFVPIFGALLSDSYLGRFRVIVLGSVASLIGMVLLWLTAFINGAHPPDCNLSLGNCKGATPSQLALLFSAFAVMSIGAGGIRPCSLAFGADQLHRKNDPNNERVLQTFFSFYYASVGISIVVAVTVIVYIQDKLGFNVGFGVPVVLMVLSAVMFLLGSPLYIKVKGNRSILAGLAQVVVASIRNRHLALPPKTTDGWYHHKNGSKLMIPTDKLRYLNKACIIRNPSKDVNSDGSASKPWNLCTVEQVEDLKSTIRVIPLWSTGITVAVIVGQHSFPVLQASTMDRRIGSSFEVPAGSFGAFAIISLTVWVAVYDRLIVPQLAKVSGRPRGLSLKQRMGIGLLMSCLATAVAATMESVRRRAAIEQGLADEAKGVVGMSAMWLVQQHCLTGLAEAFNIIGQIEFYYSELPKSMASLGVALFALGMGVGNLVGSLIIEVVGVVSGRDGGVSWVSSNLNKGHYDYYYWLLTLMGAVNFVYFLVCSWAYGEEGRNGGWEEEEEEEEEAAAEGKKKREELQTTSRSMELSMFL